MNRSLLSPALFLFLATTGWWCSHVVARDAGRISNHGVVECAAADTVAMRDGVSSCVVAKDALIGLPSIRVGSFNIQIFGISKMLKKHVVEVLIKTLERYDLVLIMEIRDVSGRAIESLLSQLNQRVGSQRSYSMALSERLGRTSSKEQYAYFYRNSVFRLASIFQYEDPQDRFERPPYGALFDVVGAHQLTRFGILGLHASPRDAYDELQALYSVQRQAKSVWQTENLLIAGDFNADCTYLNPGEKAELHLSQDPSFNWLITSCVETTMVRTGCIYDHIIATGPALASAIDAESPVVFRFDEVFQLNQTVAEEVSDHFPVEVLITGRSQVRRVGAP